MKRGGILILILLAVFVSLPSITYSQGYSKEIFDEWHGEDDEFSIGNIDFEVDEVFNNNSEEYINLIRQDTEKNYKLEFQECEEFGAYTLCVDDFEDGEARLQLHEELSQANVSIEGKILIDKFYNTKEKFKVRDTTYTVDYRHEAEKLHLNADIGISPLLSYGKCKEYDTLKFCFTGLKLDLAKGIGTITSTGVEIPQAHVVVYEKQPSISVERTFSNNNLDELKLNEEFEVEVTIENKGDIAANNLIFQQDVPEQFEVKSNPRWEGQLAANSKKTIRFYLKAIDDFDGEIEGHVNYKFDGVNETIKLDPIKIKTVSTTIKISLSEKRLRLNQKAMVNIECSNEESSAKQFSFSVALPSNLQVANTDLEKDGNNYVWEGEIDAKAKKFHTIQVKLIDEDSKGNITLIGKANKKDITRSVLVKPRPKEVEFSSFVDVEKKRLVITLTNNGRYTFTPVRVNVDNSLSKIISKLKSNNTEEVIFENYEKLKPEIEITYSFWGEDVILTNKEDSAKKSEEVIYYGDDTNETESNETEPVIPEEYKDSKPETIGTPPSNSFFARLWRFFKGLFS